MTIPTQAQLHDEVDRLYHERHTEAPYQLDPDDPDHRPWVERWLEIRDDVVNEWTNDVFFSYFAGAGKLDPNDPADADMISCWLDIRDQIRDDAPSRIDIAAVATAAAYGGSAEEESAVPMGEVEVIVQDPPAPTSWENETIVDRIFDAQLTALAQWDAALDMFDEVVEASADDETTPSFTNVARDYFVDKVVGLLSAEVPGGGEVVNIWKRLTAEVDRARSAEASTKMRDFLVDQHAQVAAFVKAIDVAREDLMPEVQRLAYAASTDATAAAEYDVLRPAIVDLAVAATALRDAADPQTYFQILVEQWLEGSSYRDELGKPAGLRIDLHADFTIRSASLTGPHAKKLGDQLEKMNRDDGIDLLAVRVPKFIRYAEQDDRWYAYLQVDADNHLEWLELGLTGDGGDDGERQGWLRDEVLARGLPRVFKLD